MRPVAIAVGASRRRHRAPDGAGYGGDNDFAIDLRVDDHPDPITEMQRLYRSTTCCSARLPTPSCCRSRGRGRAGQRLALLGYTGEPLVALESWADTENLEERLHDGKIDPVVLRILRHQSDAVEA